METGPNPPRRLLRRSDDKVVAGVAGGLADYFGIDPVWVRLGFVVSALIGAGLIAYIVCWAVMPASGTGAPQTHLEREVEKLRRSLGGTSAWGGVALVVLGLVLVATQIIEWRPGIVWGVALVLLGVLLFTQPELRTSASRISSRTPPAVPPPAPASAPAPEPSSEPSDDTAPIDAGGATATVPMATAPPLPSVPLPRAPRERSRLGWMTIGALFLTAGVAALLDVADVVRLRPVQYAALMLAVVGVGLIIGAWFGRARILTLLGLMLVPAVLAASLINVPLAGGFGERYIHPTEVDMIESEYNLLAGEMILDLRAVPFGEAPIAIRATNVAGRIIALVPPGLALEVRARAGAGQVALFGETFDGLKVDVRREYGPAEGTRTLWLDLETSLGQVEVSDEP